MRRESIVRLVLLLGTLALGMTPAPSHAFPYCPSASCPYYIWLCQEEYHGDPNYSQYWGWCDDGSSYLRGYGTVSCATDSYTYEFGECADY